MRLPDTDRVISFVHQSWGHTLSVSEHAKDWRRREFIRGCGWSTPKPAKGTVLLLKAADGGVLAFRVSKVEHAATVQDMFFFTAFHTDTPKGLS